MGQATGGGVGKLARDRRRLERRQTLPEISPDCLPIEVGPLRVEGREQRDSLGDHTAVLEPGQVPSIEVIAPADHDLHAPRRQVMQGKTRVCERGRGRVEHQELFGLSPQDGARHDPVLGRVEPERRVEVSAAAARDPVDFR